MIVRFVVPGKPQGKGRARAATVGGHARLFTPAKTVAYESLVAHEASIVMFDQPRIEGPVKLSVVAWFDVPASLSKKKRADALAGRIRPTGRIDVDNIVKAVCDGCNGIVWRDDVQVVELEASKRYGETPCVAVTAHEVHA